MDPRYLQKLSEALLRATNKGVTVEGGKLFFALFSTFSISGISGLWGHLGSISDFEDFGRYRIFQVSILHGQNGLLKDPISSEILKTTVIDPKWPQSGENNEIEKIEKNEIPPSPVTPLLVAPKVPQRCQVF